MFNNYSLCDTGLKRSKNEDKIFTSKKLILVADGMGGHKKGEVASEIAIDMFQSILLQIKDDETGSIVKDKLIEATKGSVEELTKYCEENDIKDLVGTTIVGMYYNKPEDKISVFHLGDSRAYIIRNELLQKLTIDHTKYEHIKANPNSFVNVDMESINRNQIIKAIIANQYYEPEINIFSAQKNDIYILCSDGITDLCEDDELERIILSNKDDLSKAVSKIKELVYDRGAKDNMSLIISSI